MVLLVFTIEETETVAQMLTQRLVRSAGHAMAGTPPGPESVTPWTWAQLESVILDSVPGQPTVGQPLFSDVPQPAGARSASR